MDLFISNRYNYRVQCNGYDYRGIYRPSMAGAVTFRGGCYILSVANALDTAFPPGENFL